MMLFAAETLSTGLSWEAVGVLVAAMSVIGGPIVGFAFVISSRTAVIISRLNAMDETLKKSHEEHDEFYRRLGQHDVMLAGHEERISACEED